MLDCVATASDQQTAQAVIDAVLACDTIFRSRLQGTRDGTREALRRVKELVLQIYPSTAGGNSLVWVYFIAAAESDTTADRVFFTGRLADIHRDTAYTNITKGLDILKQLWGRPPDVSWTTFLPSIATTFVM